LYGGLCPPFASKRMRPAKAASYTDHRPTVARLVSSNGGVGRRVRRRTRDVADTSRATATDPRASGLCPPHKGSHRTTGKSVGTAHPTKIAAIPGQFVLDFPTGWRHNIGSGIDEDVASLGLYRPHRILIGEGGRRELLEILNRCIDIRGRKPPCGVEEREISGVMPMSFADRPQTKDQHQPATAAESSIITSLRAQRGNLHHSSIRAPLLSLSCWS